MLFRKIYLLIFLLFFVSFSLPFHTNYQQRTVIIEASSSSQTYEATKDAYISSQYIYDNYGWEIYLWVTGVPTGLGKRRTLIQFSLNNLPPNAIILSAKLRLYILEAEYSGSRKYLYFERITGSWSEGGVCWKNQPAVTTSHRVQEKGPGRVGIWWEVAVTSQVIDALNEWDGTGSPTYGVRIRLKSEVYDYAILKFYSRDANRAPKLVVEYIENNPPSAPTLTTPVANQHFDPTSQILFSWIFNDPDSEDTQSAYRFQLDDNLDFSSPLIDTGKVSSSENSTTQTLPSTVGLYYWRVKTWDSQDAEGEWSEARPIIVDRVQVTLTVADSRVDVGSSMSWSFTATYEYDGSDATGYVTVTLNDTETTKSSVGKWSFTVESVTEDQYGLTAFTANTIECIWDRIKVIAGGVVNFTIDVDIGGKIWYYAVYEYDNSTFDDSCGVLYLNGFEMTWSGEKWVYAFPYSTEGNQMTFHITGVLDNQYGLTTINNQAGDIIINRAKMQVKVIKTAFS